MTIAPQPRDGARPGPTVRVHATESAAPTDPAADSEKPDRDRAFTAFMEAHADDLLRTAWFLSGDAHRAEELVQQALVRTYTAWHRAALAHPFPRARRIVVLRRLVGLPEAEVAASLGISVGTVKSTASRGLATLRGTLTETERSAS